MRKYREIIKYIFFGGLTTLVNWMIYVCCISVFEMEMTLSNSLAWLGAVMFAFISNKLFVFQSRDMSIKTILREVTYFFMARITSGGLEIFLPTLLVYIGLDQMLFNIEGFWAKAIVSVWVVLLNYIFSKKIVFKKQKKDEKYHPSK